MVSIPHTRTASKTVDMAQTQWTADDIDTIRRIPAKQHYRSVRLITDEGLCTCTYSYGMTGACRAEVARRIAALWNAFWHLSTEEIEALAKNQLSP